MTLLIDLAPEILSMIFRNLFQSQILYLYRQPYAEVVAPKYTTILQTCQQLYNFAIEDYRNSVRATAFIQFKADDQWELPFPNAALHNISELHLVHQAFTKPHDPEPSRSFIPNILEGLCASLKHLRQVTILVEILAGGLYCRDFDRVKQGQCDKFFHKMAFSLFDGVLWECNVDCTGIEWRNAEKWSSKLRLTFQFHVEGPLNGRMIFLHLGLNYVYGSDSNPCRTIMWEEKHAAEPRRPVNFALLSSRKNTIFHESAVFVDDESSGPGVGTKEEISSEGDDEEEGEAGEEHESQSDEDEDEDEHQHHQAQSDVPTSSRRLSIADHPYNNGDETDEDERECGRHVELLRRPTSYAVRHLCLGRKTGNVQGLAGLIVGHIEVARHKEIRREED